MSVVSGSFVYGAVTLAKVSTLDVVFSLIVAHSQCSEISSTTLTTANIYSL